MDANQLVLQELGIKIANLEVTVAQLRVENSLLNEQLNKKEETE